VTLSAIDPNDRLRVLALIDHFAMGGAETLLPRFAAAAPTAGIDIQIACVEERDGNPAAAPLYELGQAPVNLSLTGRHGPGAVLAVRRHLARVRPQVVHTHLGTSDVLGGLAARSLGIPAVSTIHAAAWPGRLELRRRVVKHCASRVIAVSESARAEYLRHGWAREDQIVTIHNGIDVVPCPGAGAEVRRELGFGPEALVLGMVSALRPEKGHDIALEAVRRLRSRIPQLRLLIVGRGGVGDDIGAQAAALGDAVVMAGQRDDVMRVFDAIDICLQPSREDAFPTTLIEAMAASVPIVATAVGGIPELVSDGRTGVLVPAPPRAEPLLEALDQLLRDPSLRRQLAAAARDEYERRFTAAPWVRTTRALYDAVLAESPPRRGRRPDVREAGAREEQVLEWTPSLRRAGRPDVESREPTLPYVPPSMFAAGAVVAAGLLGRFMADGRLKYGVGLIFVACYVPLVMFDLAAAFAVFVSVQYFQDLSILSSAPNAMGVLVGLGWIGAFLGRRGQIEAIRQHGRLLVTVILFCCWMTLTIAWSQQPGLAGTAVGFWWLAAFALLIALTTLTSARDFRFVALAIVIGAVISVMIGLATGSIAASINTVNQTAVQGRFTGGGGDPNEQAAAFVPALFLIVGLIGIYRQRAMRIALVLAFGLIAVGFFATQSRGGLVSLAAASLAALFLAPRYRRRIFGLSLIVVLAAVAIVATNPGALTRIVDVGGGSSGRNDLWRVGWEVFTAHPILGVGAANFTVVESHYVLRPGTITHIQYLVNVPYLVSSAYLQQLAESGVIGLIAYLAVMWACLRATWRAIKRLDALGWAEYADLGRAILLGTIGMLSAVFFISDGNDWRLWVLLGMGPALLTLAGRLQARAP
jgi:glycosyltransferase involved in cell wall biosynthesis/O-antigen ligase